MCEHLNWFNRLSFSQVVYFYLFSEMIAFSFFFTAPICPAQQETTNQNSVSGPFRLVDQPGQYVDMEFREKRRVRLVYQQRDGSSESSHYFTYKPFHQIYDPSTGSVPLTSGVHPPEENPQYPHHRGLFFGFNKINYSGLKADTWHCTSNVYTQVEQITEQTVADDHCRLAAMIGWYGTDGLKFAEEKRTVTLYDHSDGILLDWSTELSTDREKVTLDGDPQHAGFHFRANQEVAKKTSKLTWYVRPDGIGLPGETRNWNPQSKDPKTIDLPWNAVSFMISDRRFSVLRITHPDNSGETRGSERDYGRFGDYFEYQLSPSNPLRLKYRIFATEGELSVERAQKLADDFRDSGDVN